MMARRATTDWRQTAGQGVRWGVKSVGGLLVNLALLTVWVDVVGLSPALAIVPNYAILSVAGYVVTDRWVYPEGLSPGTWRGHGRQYVGQQVAMLLSKGINFVLYLVLLPVVEYRVAWVLGAVVSVVLTFSLTRWWWEAN